MSIAPDISAGLSVATMPEDVERLSFSAVVNGQRRLAETAEPVTIIGSRRDCGLPLPHPSVGKLHAAIVHLGDRVVLCDLRGREDTIVNGTPIDRITLAPGMEIQIGEVAVTVDFGEKTQLSAEPPEPCNILLYENDQPMKVDQAVTVIGRWAASNIVLGTSDVSLSHALIFPFFGKPLIADLASRSGLVVNGELCSFSWLENEDAIKIGEHMLYAAEIPNATEEPPFQPQVVPADEQLLEELMMESSEPPAIAAAPDIQTESEVGDLSSSLAALRTQFTQAQESLSQQAAGIREHAAKLAARESELELKLQDITAREEELTAREQREAEAAQQLAQFRNALQEASSAFANYVPPADDALPAPMVNGNMFNAADSLQAGKAEAPPAKARQQAIAIAN